MRSSRALFTRADYDLLPEGFPAELVGGSLAKDAPPTPGHQWVAMRVARTLIDLVGESLVLMAPCGVAIDEHNVYSPDVVVLRSPPRWDERYVGIPLVAIEVLSKSTERRDRSRKAPRLLAAGTAEVWLLDPLAATAERRTRDGSEIAAGDRAIASLAVPGFGIVPSKLFSRPR